MATQQAVRRWIMTAAVAGITITGTIYGATLKGEQDVQKEKKRVLQATPEERIAQLEVARADLVLRRNELERKIATFHHNQKERDQERGEPK